MESMSIQFILLRPFLSWIKGALTKINTLIRWEIIQGWMGSKNQPISDNFFKLLALTRFIQRPLSRKIGFRKILLL